MSNYELYERVLSALKEDEGTFNAAARNWIEGADDASFADNEANELFNMAKIACYAWRNKAINGRVSKHRMIEYVRKIAEKNLPNPYPDVKEYGVNPEKVKLVDEPEAIQGSTVKHVLGVVPEVAEPVKEEVEPKVQAEVKTEPKEEPKEEKPKFFGKHKKR